MSDSDKYMCWNADQETESDAKAIEATSWKEAALEFAERDFNEEPYDEVTVRVRTPLGALYEIEYEAEQEISFWPGIGRKLEGPSAKRGTP